MTSATSYVVSATGKDGRFSYEVDGSGLSPHGRYNILRHAGTIYSLAAYDADHPSPAVRKALVASARYLRTGYLRPLAVGGNAPVNAILSLPGEEGVGLSPVVKLGGSALGLLALARARQLDESIISIDELRGLGRFILFMQRKDGSFRSTYNEGHPLLDISDLPYFPGEAIFALSILYQIDPDPTWLNAGLRSARYLVDSQKTMARSFNDHWLMIAIAELLRLHARASNPPVSKGELLDHAIAIGQEMIREQGRTGWLPGVTGAFTFDAQTTPTSTRLEGLAAIYPLLPPAHSLRPAWHDALQRGVEFLLACQERDGANTGGFRKALRARGGDPDWRHVRIDYVQHALSALVGFARAVTTSETRNN